MKNEKQLKMFLEWFFTIRWTEQITILTTTCDIEIICDYLLVLSQLLPVLFPCINRWIHRIVKNRFYFVIESLMYPKEIMLRQQKFLLHRQTLKQINKQICNHYFFLLQENQSLYYLFTSFIIIIFLYLYKKINK